MSVRKYYLLGGKQIQRCLVSEDKRLWNQEFAHYSPPNLQMDFSGKSWADPDIGVENFHPKWNQLDGKVDRKSHSGEYVVTEAGYPLNPSGRTGVRGRGVLGRWGPNHAADPIVSRWQRVNGEIAIHSRSGKPVLEFVAIRRRDTKEWALPGGMVDPGEAVSSTVKREFMEEALNLLESPEKRAEIEAKMKELFANGVEIYRGIVDDPRNTDNAWMETVVFNFHDKTGEVTSSLGELEAGDDAIGVQWLSADSDLNLYANHKSFIERTVERLFAHF